ncbi:MAG TPA: undecaprenyl-phosphate glucose phosphotransferase [Candidatus Brocadiia bacterium]|nr:undecaprenyl-phosphate glucose phosphotransferase [Candidatus Brocadiia bacterium]
MLKKHSELLVAGLRLLDLAAIAGAWMLSYLLAFRLGAIPTLTGAIGPGMEDPIRYYARALIVILPVAAVVFQQQRLYVPRRVGRLFEESAGIVMAVAITAVVSLALGGAIRFEEIGPDGAIVVKPYILKYSRNVMAAAGVLGVVGLALERLLVRSALRKARRRGWNQRKALVVGAGRLGQKLVERFRRNPWTGIQPVGYADDRPERIGRSFGGVKVICDIASIAQMIEKEGVDQLFIALPASESDKAQRVLDQTGEAMVDVRLIPDFHSVATLNAEIGDFDGLPIISLRQTPLAGWSLVLKRGLDLAVGGLACIILAAPMAVVAIIIKLTSPGPVFYRQQRLGMDGRLFDCIKFRSMRTDAEAAGAMRTTPGDPRRTRFGTFIRKFNIDELPQLINVLRGDMSLVGPRPERPVFVDEYKKRIPGYMFRHKIKAGMTGWAQINGWRGDTSLEKRIQYDLYYIEHWSIWFDIYIIAMTPFKGLQNAY